MSIWSLRADAATLAKPDILTWRRAASFYAYGVSSVLQWSSVLLVLITSGGPLRAKTVQDPIRRLVSCIGGPAPACGGLLLEGLDELCNLGWASIRSTETDGWPRELRE